MNRINSSYLVCGLCRLLCAGLASAVRSASMVTGELWTPVGREDTVLWLRSEEVQAGQKLSMPASYCLSSQPPQRPMLATTTCFRLVNDPCPLSDLPAPTLPSQTLRTALGALGEVEGVDSRLEGFAAGTACPDPKAPPRSALGPGRTSWHRLFFLFFPFFFFLTYF